MDNLLDSQFNVANENAFRNSQQPDMQNQRLQNAQPQISCLHHTPYFSAQGISQKWREKEHKSRGGGLKDTEKTKPLNQPANKNSERL